MFAGLGRGRLRHTLREVSFAWKRQRKSGVLTAFTELVELLEGFDLATVACDDSK